MAHGHGGRSTARSKFPAVPCMRDLTSEGKRVIRRQRRSRLKAYPSRMEMESARIRTAADGVAGSREAAGAPAIGAAGS